MQSTYIILHLFYRLSNKCCQLKLMRIIGFFSQVQDKIYVFVQKITTLQLISLFAQVRKFAQLISVRFLIYCFTAIFTKKKNSFFSSNFYNIDKQFFFQCVCVVLNKLKHKNINQLTVTVCTVSVPLADAKIKLSLNITTYVQL